MKRESTHKFSVYVSWAVKRLALGMFDIMAVNLAYFLALVVRFYVNREFRAVALQQYLPAFWEFAPYYTVLCLVVFMVFKLYNNRWKQAGLHDLNRIFGACLVTSVLHVAGTLLFVRRMPITYYFIGAVLQFLMIAASRFAYRLVVMESNRLRNMRRASVNTMIVGVGETARLLRNHIETNQENAIRPVCVFSYHTAPAGKLINGIPVVTGVEKLPEHFAEYKVKCVILADTLMPTGIRKQIREACEASKIEIQDFSGYLGNDGAGITLKNLMEYAAGPVEIRMGGQTGSFQSGEEALMAFPGKYDVKSLYGSGEKLGVEISPKTTILNDTNQDWVRDTEDKSGEEISFF